MASTLTFWSFNGVSSSPYGWNPQLDRPARRPAGVTHMMNGTAVYHSGNFVEDDYFSWSGLIASDLFATLKGYFDNATTGTLSGTGGLSVTALLTRCEKRDLPGPTDADDHLVFATFEWQRYA